MDLTFLVVDDESLSRVYIRALISEIYPGGRIMEASSAKAALALLEDEEVDVMFLDVKMPGTDGFQLLDSLPARKFEVVFITAYSQYAINAIKQQAFDYLLKPLRKSEFRDTLQQVVRKCEAKKLLPSPAANGYEEYQKGKISISHLSGVKMIALNEIVYLKAANTYTTIYLTTGEKFTASKPISRFETLLLPPWFFRIHKSFIVNMSFLKEYVSQDGHFALMSTGDQLSISRYRVNDFLNTLRLIAEERNL